MEGGGNELVTDTVDGGHRGRYAGGRCHRTGVGLDATDEGVGEAHDLRVERAGRLGRLLRRLLGGGGLGSDARVVLDLVGVRQALLTGGEVLDEVAVLASLARPHFHAADGLALKALGVLAAALLGEERTGVGLTVALDEHEVATAEAAVPRLGRLHAAPLKVDEPCAAGRLDDPGVVILGVVGLAELVDAPHVGEADVGAEVALLFGGSTLVGEFVRRATGGCRLASELRGHCFAPSEGL